MSTFRPKNFMLLPTMACQAQCSYCFARKNGETMSDEVADAALDFIARTAPEGEDFQLTFHGGEPMLASPGYYERILPKIQQRLIICFLARKRLKKNWVYHSIGSTVKK